MHHLLRLSAASLQSLCKTKWLLNLGCGWRYVRSNTKIAKSLLESYETSFTPRQRKWHKKITWVRCRIQWRNRHAGEGGRVPPETCDGGNLCWPTGKKEARKKGIMEKKRRKMVKRKVENWKWKEGKVTKWGEDFFFFHFSKPLHSKGQRYR